MHGDDLVTSTKQIRQNVDTLFGFASGSPQQARFHRARIKNGKNFVAVSGQGNFNFSPSKFAGYIDNGIHHADRLRTRDGRQTDLQIT
jgi:hypothetical protein